MMKLVIIIFTTILSMPTFANDLDNSGFKRVELGLGIVYGETGYGAKVKYQLSDYLIGLELNSIDLSDSYILGPNTRDINNESDDYWVFSASIGKDWSYGWFHVAVDVGVGYGAGGDHNNCTDEYNNDNSYELCDYEVERAITVPISVTFVLGKKTGIGLSLTHAFSSLDHNSGLKVIIPFGSFD
ncbi:MAG: hypothetical protein V5789_08110 [Colwellia sp.]